MMEYERLRTQLEPEVAELLARMREALAGREKLEALGRAGLVVSIAYGPMPDGVGYSVDCLHDATQETFAKPFAARSFGHCLEIVELEARKRGWIA